MFYKFHLAIRILFGLTGGSYKRSQDGVHNTIDYARRRLIINLLEQTAVHYLVHYSSGSQLVSDCISIYFKY